MTCSRGDLVSVVLETGRGLEPITCLVVQVTNSWDLAFEVSERLGLIDRLRAARRSVETLEEANWDFLTHVILLRPDFSCDVVVVCDGHHVLSAKIWIARRCGKRGAMLRVPFRCISRLSPAPSLLRGVL